MTPYNPYDSEEMEIARRLRNAQMLQGQVQGAGPFTGAVNAYFAGVDGRRAKELSEALQLRREQDWRADVARFQQAAKSTKGTPAELYEDASGNVTESKPAVAPRSMQEAMLEALTGMKSPQGMQMALGLMKPGEGFTLSPGQTRHSGTGEVLARGATERPASPPRRVVLPPNARLLEEDGTVIADNPRPDPASRPPPGYRVTREGNLEAIPGGPADQKLQGQFNQDTATLTNTEGALDRLSVAANELMRHPGVGRITGLAGVLPNVPGMAGADAQAKLQTLKAQVGFGVLQEMRNASRTGGALGAVTEKELGFLQNALAALDNAQSEAQFRESLQKIMDYSAAAKARLRNAFNMKHNRQQQAPVNTAPPAQAPSRVIRWDQLK